ncbi:hypothetical protein NLG97_g8063 [Lecanicillium saksenae]|uniref:Uncharacterized protein n=1 Tax=Lecanicillium saksenae TaxID=468837 RepID=A0ACC1QKL0_9HYPO|nr:hypothetical protein NLG97_g8063 [Lecanicillium saksenae]
MKPSLLSPVLRLLGCVSLALANKQPHLATDPKTIKECSFWYDNTGDRTCESIRNAWKILPETFSRWNPSIGLNCEGWRFQSYCVRVKAEETTSSPTSTSTTSSTSSTTTETAPPIWTDKGCYQDAATHPFQTRLSSPGGNDLTRAKCEASCWSAGYLYAGFKSGVECWCGKYVQGSLSPSASDCNVACAGNSSETCGGSTFFDVVLINLILVIPSSRTSIPLPTKTAGWSVLGCHKDTANPRILKEYQISSSGFEYRSRSFRLRWQICGAGARIYISKYNTVPIAHDVAYYSNLTSGHMLPWTVFDGAYDASTKALVAAPSGGGTVFLDQSDFSDFLHELDLFLHVSQDGRNVGLMFRASNPGVGLDSYDGYFAVFVGKADIQAVLTHHIAVRAIGKQLDLYIDNMTASVLIASDSTYTHGMVGMRVFSTGATFTNVNLYPIAFMDDFRATNALDRWQVNDGQFLVFGALYTKTPGKALINGTIFKDFIYEADVNPNKGRSGLLFRMRDAQDAGHGFRGFYAGLGGGFVELGRIDSFNQYIQLLNVPLDAAISGSSHHLRVKAVGYEIYLYVDDMNTPKLHLADGSYMSGQNSIQCFETGSYVMNVKVYTL